MEAKLKKMISPIICIVAGILGLIFMGLDHINDGYVGLNGYDYIGYNFSYWELTVFQVFDAIMLVIMIILPIVLMVLGVLHILSIFLDMVSFFEKAEPIVGKIGNIIMISYSIVTALSFIFGLIFCLCNSYTRVLPGVGAYLLICFAIVEAVAVAILNRLFANVDKSPRLVYVCTSCGKTCRNGDRFCDVCGKPVEPKTLYPVIYSCSACGHKATAKDRFCPVCGKPIIKREAIPTVSVCPSCGHSVQGESKFCPVCGTPMTKKEMRANLYACSVCGAPAKAGDKFCSACGGAVTQKNGAFNVCSVCGKEAKETDKFCSACGGTVVSK